MGNPGPASLKKNEIISEAAVKSGGTEHEVISVLREYFKHASTRLKLTKK